MLTCSICGADVTGSSFTDKAGNTTCPKPCVKKAGDATIGELEQLRARLDAIAADFALATSALADGNRSAEARLRIWRALEGHVPMMVTAGTYAAAQERAEKAEKERDEARAEVARLRAERDHIRGVLCAARDESSAGIRDEWDAAHGGTNARDAFAPEHDPVIHGAEQKKEPK